MPKKHFQHDDWFRCPCCGAELPANSHFCRECGASEDSGWGGEAWDAEDDFDYDEFVEREFSEHAPRDPKRSAKRFWVVVFVVLVVIAFLVASWGPWR